MVEVMPLNLSSDINQPKPIMAKKSGKGKIILWFVGLILLGTASGYGLVSLKQGKSASVKYLSRDATGSKLEKGSAFGVDEKGFKDIAEGQIAKGGIDGEGSHHLIREGGESQFVYLTSSIIDLDQFVDKKVKVWGETFEAQKAGWLMDVGRLEVIE